MKEKTPLLHKFVCFQIPNKRISGLKYFNIWVTNYLFSKATLLQREPFLTFYTNSFPLLLTKYVFMLTIFRVIKLPIVSSAFKSLYAGNWLLRMCVLILVSSRMRNVRLLYEFRLSLYQPGEAKCCNFKINLDLLYKFIYGSSLVLKILVTEASWIK